MPSGYTDGESCVMGLARNERHPIARVQCLLALLVVLVGGCNQVPLAAAVPRIGMNLAAPAYYSGEAPFLDRFKTASPWRMWGSDKDDPSLIDAHGNVARSVPVGAVLGTAVAVDAAGARPRRYVFLYEGKGDFDFVYARRLATRPGRITFEYTGQDLFVPVRLTITDPADPPRNIHVVREDQAAALAAGELFDPRFLALARHWSTLRMMDWMQTNSVRPAPWAGRARIDDATWTRDGIPLEILVKLANEADTDLWINVPTRADDGWVREAMALIKGSLDPKHRLYVEYANEVWNFGLPASHYAQTEGNRLWGTDVNHDGVVNPNDQAENFGPGWVTWYGYRSAQIAAAARSVFTGADAPRLRTVISTQTDWQGLEKSVFDGVARAKRGEVSALFTDYAITTYFGGDLGSKGSGPDAERILGWARSGESGLAAAFAHLRDGSGGLSVELSLATLAKTMTYQGNVARAHKLALVAYEGGAHVTALDFQDARRTEMVDFLRRMQNDPRMGELYGDMVRRFGEAGGQLLSIYNDIGPPGQWGYFGILDTIDQPTSARFEAVKAAAARGKAAGAAPAH